MAHFDLTKWATVAITFRPSVTFHQPHQSEVNVDPFLLAHRINSQLYDIGPHFSPISIRDQMIRAHAIVTRAIRDESIGAGKPLLVVGAGVAGVTAALIAADHDVETTLIERGKGPFALQLRTQTRFLDPTQYDWPSPHWGKGVFPWTGAAHPLRWEAGVSSTIAGSWENTLNEVMDDIPALRVLFDVELDDPTGLAKATSKGSKGLTQVYFRRMGAKARNGPHEYAMIVSCTGAGPERVEVGDYRSRKFWEDDPFSERNLGLGDSRPIRVYISGGGDGALQDFLRIVTKVQSAKEILEVLPEGLKEEAAREIGSMEEYYLRSFIWCGTREDDHSIQDALHREYERLVADWITRYKGGLDAQLKPILRSFLDDLLITLAYTCTHFAHCYALNHFLALLLARYIEAEFGKTILRPRMRTASVEGIEGHGCKKDPDDCEGAYHNVKVIAAEDCFTPRGPAAHTAAPTLIRDNPYNIVIIRHGIDWNSPLFGCPPNSNHRHLLPYYLGW